MDEDEMDVLFERAQPIQNMLDMARSRLSYIKDFEVGFVLDRMVRLLKAFHVGEMACGGIGLKITAEPIDNHSSMQMDELPRVVADIIGLQYVIRCGIRGLERGSSKPVPMPYRLRILANLCGRESVIGTRLVKFAAEEAFLIVTRKWLEDEFAKGWEIFNLSWTRVIKIAEDIPKREGEKLEFSHKVASLGEDVRLKCSHAKAQHQEAGLPPENPKSGKMPISLLMNEQLPSETKAEIRENFRRLVEACGGKEGEIVEAPAFANRPVPKPETPAWNPRKPIKR